MSLAYVIGGFVFTTFGSKRFSSNVGDCAQFPPNDPRQGNEVSQVVWILGALFPSASEPKVLQLCILITSRAICAPGRGGSHVV
jgi:hypothetical protein